MSKGYKKEYIDKVKQKFNDIQSSHTRDKVNNGKQCNDKNGQICNSNRVDKLRK